MRLLICRRWIRAGSLFGALLLRTTAAPVNDAFSAATTIPPVRPSTQKGTNVGATVEAGEPLLPLSAHTVWWNWTPSTSGWVRIFTVGTDADTQLAAYTGDSVGGLTRIGFNDDIGGGTEIGPSELILPVAAGQTLRLQVSGYAGWTGEFTLDVATTSLPPRVTALGISPAAIDVSNQDATATIELQIAHSAGLRNGLLSLVRTDGVVEDSVFVDSRYLVSGTATSGTYRVPLTVRARVAPGDFTLMLDVSGRDGRRTVYGERTPMPSGLPSTVKVINTGVIDALPPQLAEVTVAPASVDVTDTAQTVTLTTRLVDPTSGVIDFICRLDLRTPSGDVLSGDVFSRRNRTAGTGFDGTYAIKVTLPAGSPPGNYPLAYRLVDALDNRINYGPLTEAGEGPMPAGLPDHLVVVNRGTVDVVPPILTAVTFTASTVNIAESEPLSLSLGVSDARSGAVTVELGSSEADSIAGLQPTGGGAMIPLSMSFYRTSGTPTEGGWQGSSPLPTDLAAGTYRVVGFRLVDALENEATYGPASLGLTPFPAGIDPVVTIVRQALPGPYEIWLKRYPALVGSDADRGADPDHDGLPNLLELALGTDPLVPTEPGGADPNAAHAPRFYHQPGKRISMDYTIVPENLGEGVKRIRVTPQQSTDLRLWEGAIQLILGDNASTSYISVSADPKKWLRLWVQDPAVDPGL